jgi:hypothetical protein
MNPVFVGDGTGRDSYVKWGGDRVNFKRGDHSFGVILKHEIPQNNWASHRSTQKVPDFTAQKTPCLTSPSFAPQKHYRPTGTGRDTYVFRTFDLPAAPVRHQTAAQAKMAQLQGSWNLSGKQPTMTPKRTPADAAMAKRQMAMTARLSRLPPRYLEDVPRRPTSENVWKGAGICEKSPFVSSLTMQTARATMPRPPASGSQTARPRRRLQV